MPENLLNYYFMHITIGINFSQFVTFEKSPKEIPKKEYLNIHSTRENCRDECNIGFECGTKRRA